MIDISFQIPEFLFTWVFWSWAFAGYYVWVLFISIEYFRKVYTNSRKDFKHIPWQFDGFELTFAWLLFPLWGPVGLIIYGGIKDE